MEDYFFRGNNMKNFQVRGFNPCESLLRHTPSQLTKFIRRMKDLDFNSIIIHSDYGYTRYRELLEKECQDNGVEITLMVFGPRTFYSLVDWKSSYFAKDENGVPFTKAPECETHPCASNIEAIEAFKLGAERYLSSLPSSVKRLHMRAGDGLLFCRCPKCRVLPEHEQWQVFVEAFVQAAKKVAPHLKLETDLYIKRYSVPKNHEAFGQLDRIMFDTFYRHPFFPIGSPLDQCNRFVMQYAAPDGFADSDTPNQYYLKRLEEWNKLYPGKLYIHENVMCQGYFGCPQYNTDVYLEDQKIYQKLGLAGVCYEAYEPGFGLFEKMFYSLAKGERIDEPSLLEKYLPTTNLKVFCHDLNFPFDDYLDSYSATIAKFLCISLNGITAKDYQNLVEFEWDNEEKTDPILVGFGAAKNGLAKNVISFDNLSNRATDFLSRRKLWDFMEEIPLTEDPRAVCKEIILELAQKVKDV